MGLDARERVELTKYNDFFGSVGAAPVIRRVVITDTDFLNRIYDLFTSQTRFESHPM